MKRLEVRGGTEEKIFHVKTTDAGRRIGQRPWGPSSVQYRKAPIEVSISSKDIGGPSAGLIYALSIYDRLVPDDITGGRTIAGTGTIENCGQAHGTVGAVGSVDLKVKGAEPDRRRGVPGAQGGAGGGAGGGRLESMEVIGVSTLTEAIAELKKLPPTKIAQKRP